MPYTRKQKVSEARLRQLYNAHVAPGVASGHFMTVTKSSRPARASFLPPGSTSDMIDVYNSIGRWVAIAHAYVLPNGTYGASGQLDPKRVLVGTTLYYV